MPTSPTPWLVAFTLGGDRERERRRLLPAQLGDLEITLHRRCVEATLDAGLAAGYRLALAAPEDVRISGAEHRLTQRGTTFAARLSSVLRDAWRRLDGPVVVVGTDTPDLAPSHLQRTHRALARDPEAVVIGPAHDGGIYLLASRRPIEGLDGVRWRRADTRRQVAALVRAAGRTLVELESLGDLDTRRALDRWLRRKAAELAPLRRGIRTALRALARPECPQRLGRPAWAAVPVPTGRAPPS